MASTSVTPITNGAAPPVDGAAEQMTEEEAALYDRQLRLWGSVAQSRIRQCRALIAPFQGGLAVETAKNLILAGVKELILLDDAKVDGYSLAAGFVWREEDIGKNRVEAAHARLSALNPHVTITTVVQTPTLQSMTPFIEDSASPLSALVYTNSNPFALSALPLSDIEKLNSLCRARATKFHLGQAQGLDGLLFQDLGNAHQFLVERKQTTRDEKNATVEKTWTQLEQQDFVPLAASLQHQWKASSSSSAAAVKRKLRNSENLWGTWAIWHLRDQGEASGPEDVLPSTLLSTVSDLLSERGLDPDALWSSVGPSTGSGGVVDPQAWAESFLTNAIPLHPAQPADFAATTAVLGGILAQEVLNAVGGREAPKVANWTVFYGLRGQAPIFALGGITAPKSVFEGSADVNVAAPAQAETEGNGDAKGAQAAAAPAGASAATPLAV